MMVRGGAIPTCPLAFMPIGRMGPPLRSFAADAHDCIMVQVVRPTGYKVVARTLIVISTAPSGTIVLEAVKVRPGKSGTCPKFMWWPTLKAGSCCAR